MSTDWGTQGTGTFTATSHSQIYDAIDPTKVSLPEPFVVCVVGASRGIGAGVAFAFAKAGATGLILASRRIPGLEATAAECKTINPKIETAIISCDITSAESVASLASDTKAIFGRVDAVVVNSGYSGPVKLKVTETDPETFMNATNVNYTGTFLVAKYFIPILLFTPSGCKCFLAISSLASLIVRGPIANAQYCVSKAAQLKLLEHIHEQYFDEEQGGLATYAIHPGAVLSEMAEETTPEVFRPWLVDSPELCGGFCVWLVKDNTKRSWLTGRLLSAKWDCLELEERKDEIVAKDLLKLKLTL